MNRFIEVNDCQRTYFEIWYGWSKGNKLMCHDITFNTEQGVRTEIPILASMYGAEVFRVMYVEQRRTVAFKVRSKH